MYNCIYGVSGVFGVFFFGVCLIGDSFGSGITCGGRVGFGIVGLGCRVGEAVGFGVVGGVCLGVGGGVCFRVGVGVCIGVGGGVDVAE